MKILILTYYWPPSGGAGVQRWLKLTKYLSLNRDVNPIILAPDVQYAMYPIIDKSLSNDIAEGVKVYTTKSFDWTKVYKWFTHSKSMPYGGFANTEKDGFKQKLSRFIRGNFFLPDVRKTWNKYAYTKACDLITNEGIDVIITTGPPHSTHLIGCALKDKYNIPWIADFRDPWTDIYYYRLMYPTLLARKIDASMQRKVLEKCDKIITVSENIKQLLSFKSPKVGNDKIWVMPNGYDLADYPQEKPQKHDCFTITYTGTLSSDYPIDGLLTALDSLKNNNRFQLRFFGKVDASIQSRILDVLGDRVSFVNHIPHKDSVRALVESDMLLLIIPNVSNNMGILTGKLFEYLGSRVPILALGPKEGDAAKIIHDTNAGKMFDYNDVNAIQDFTSELIKGNHLFVSKGIEQYERSNQASQLISYIMSLLL